MLTTVVDALKALPVRWFGSDQAPDPRTLSHKAFVMELATLDSKIFAWVHELQTHTSFEEARTHVNLHYDLGMTARECQDMLHRVEEHFNLRFTQSERHRLLKRGINVVFIHSVAKQAACRRDHHAAP